MSATPINIAAAIEQTLHPECAHHWVIEPAEGPFSEGACRKCGEVKTFINYIERHDWNQVQAPLDNSQSPGVEPSALELETKDGAAKAS